MAIQPQSPVLLDRRQPPPGRMTMEEFFEWADEDTHAEWVDGEVILLSPVSDPHQALVQFLTTLIQHFIEAQATGGAVRTGPYSMKLISRPSVREPDVVYVAPENIHRLQENALNGPADLAVEIISPESRTRDRRDKRDEYAKSGIREYWLIDLPRKKAEFLRLGTKDTYEAVLLDEDGIYRSIVLPGFWLKVDWLWQKPLPTLMTVLKAWGIV